MNIGFEEYLSMKVRAEKAEAELRAALSAKRDLEERVRQAGWIEIKNGLPKHRQVVRIICGDGAYQEVAVYRADKIGNKWECHSGYIPQDITHWKPLDWPAAPPEDMAEPLVPQSPGGSK